MIHWGTRILLVWLLMGCHDPDSFLSGKWFTAELTTEDSTAMAQEVAALLGCKSDGCALFVELNLGHYGEDVVGVIRFYRDKDRVSATACDIEGCGCQSIRGVYRGDDVFRFTFRDCAGCLRTAEIQRETDDRIIWKLNNADKQVSMDVECLTPTPDISADLPFDRLTSESRLTVADKACDECAL